MKEKPRLSMDTRPLGIPAKTHTFWSKIATGGAALRHRNFRLFFFGQLISLIGSWMQIMAQSWLVFTLTNHSAFQLGVVSAFQYAPVLLFSLPAGVIVERSSKRRIVIGTQTAFTILAAVLGMLVLTHTVQIWHVYMIAALFGTVNAFDVPGRQALMIEMVGREDLMNGIALNSSIFNASRIFGPAIAAVLIAQLGIGINFILNAVSFIPVIFGLVLMHITIPIKAITKEHNIMRQIGEGLSYIQKNESIGLLFFIVSMINVFGIPMYATLLPVFATKVLHSNVNGLGLMNVGLGVGAFIGAIVLAYVPPGPVRKRILLSSSIGLGIALIAFALSQTLVLSVILLSFVGYCVVSINSAGNALVQSSTPDRLRSRVMSVWGLVLIGLTPFGSFLAGSLAQQFDAQLAVVSGAIICLAAALFTVYWNHVLTHRHEQLIIPLNELEMVD